MNGKRILVSLGLLLAVTLVLPAAPGVGLDQSDKPIRLSPDHLEHYQEYGIIPVAETTGEFVTIDDCKELPSCDAVPFLLELPSSDWPHKIVLLITFEAGQDLAGQEHQNDLDIYVVARRIITTYYKGQRTGTTCTYDQAKDVTTCEAVSEVRQGTGATASAPETIKMADLPRLGDRRTAPLTQAERDAKGFGKDERYIEYWILVHNFLGASDYQIKATLSPIDFTFERPKQSFFQRFFGGDDDKSTAKSPGLSGDTGVDTTGEELEPVKEPGADGPLAEHDLFAIKGETAREDPGLNPIIPIAIAIVLLGASSAGFFYLRARRERAEA